MMATLHSRQLEIVGYLDEDKFLRCPGCARPEQRETPIYENTTPYCDESCDYCGKPLLSEDLSVQGYWFKSTGDGVRVYRRGRSLGSQVGKYPENTEAALQLLERLAIDDEEETVEG
jgi:hypothetical protein